MSTKNKHSEYVCSGCNGECIAFGKKENWKALKRASYTALAIVGFFIALSFIY